MSQKATRKSSGVPEDKEKEKRQAESPVKDMKKKMAANAEKEKAAEKVAEKPSKSTDKPAEKSEKAPEKKPEKNGAVADKSDKKTESKPAEKKEDKKDAQDKKDDAKAEKSGKGDKDAKSAPAPQPKPQQNGSKAHNGVTDVTLSGRAEPSRTEPNGTVSDEDGDTLAIDSEPEQEQDDLFPELAYDDASDVELDATDAPSRSLTRRSQVKPTRTPETPRPGSDKQDALEVKTRTPEAPRPGSKDDSQDTEDPKVQKLKEDAAPTDRKLRSADSPKRETKKAAETPKKGQEKADTEEVTKNGEKDPVDKLEMEVTVDIEHDADGVPRKAGTNYSRSRVRVSPYRRSAAKLDTTTSSVAANYTGNNTTMEMDITAETSSFVEEPSLDEDASSSYLSGLRNIKGRRSYKPLKEMTLRHVAAKRNVVASGVNEPRPTAPVVGRKRKPEPYEPIELAFEASEPEPDTSPRNKRLRLLERLAMPFRRGGTAPLPLPLRRNAEIVGINTDLPLSAPVALPDTIDPEVLKTTTAPVPLPTETDRDGKRCIVM